MRQLGASLGVSGVKLAGHQEVVGRSALRSSAELGEDAAGDRPFATKRGALSFAGQGNGHEPYGLKARQPDS